MRERWRSSCKRQAVPVAAIVTPTVRVHEQVEAWHAGHLFRGGMHWIAACPKCSALIKQADAIVVASGGDGDNAES